MTRALIDVDGVAACFDCAWLEAYRTVTGTMVLPHELTDWDYMSYLPGAKEKKQLIEAYSHAPGFCHNLPEYPGAVAAIKRIMTVAEVVFVTSPLDSRYWAREREQWLEQRFGPCKIVSTKHKEFVKGDLLVDDRPANVRNWLAEWPSGKGIVFAQPYNSGTTLHRTDDWQEIYDACSTNG